MFPWEKGRWKVSRLTRKVAFSASLKALSGLSFGWLKKELSGIEFPFYKIGFRFPVSQAWSLASPGGSSVVPIMSINSRKNLRRLWNRDLFIDRFRKTAQMMHRAMGHFSKEAEWKSARIFTTRTSRRAQRVWKHSIYTEHNFEQKKSIERSGVRRPSVTGQNKNYLARMPLMSGRS